MKLLIEHGRGGLYLVTTPKERRKFRELMNLFHPQSYVVAPMMRGKRDLVYMIAGDWTVLMQVHKINNFNLSMKYRLDWEETWFVRRIVSLPMAKEKYGDVAVEALQALEAWLKKGGNEAILTLTLPDHSGGLYKKAGYEKLARTNKGDKIWFVRWLKERKG